MHTSETRPGYAYAYMYIRRLRHAHWRVAAQHWRVAAQHWRVAAQLAHPVGVLCISIRWHPSVGLSTCLAAPFLASLMCGPVRGGAWERSDTYLLVSPCPVSRAASVPRLHYRLLTLCPAAY